jgi:hypothetical protein
MGKVRTLLKKVRGTAPYDKTPKEKAKRAARGRARYAIAKKKGNGDAKKGLKMIAGLDVDHKDGNPHNNNSGNLTLKKPSVNRSFPRNSKAGKLNRTA